LGRPQLSGYASLDNPLGLNDVLSLSGSSNTQGLNSEHRSQSLSLNYSIPFWYNTLSYSRSESRFAQVVQGTTAHFLSSGTSSTDEVRLDHIAYRSASTKLGVYAALSSRRAESFLDDVELIVQRRRTTNFEIGTNYKKLIGDANVSFELGYRRGVPWKDAQDDFEDNEEGLTVRPKLWLLSASFSKPFAIGSQSFQYSTSLRGQHTKDATLSVDQFSIGNRYSVRGFDGDSVLLAESGFFLRNDIATQLKLIEGVDIQAYIGIDIGRVWGPSDIQLIGTKLAGAAAGIRGQWKKLQWDIALGTPLYRPEGFRTNNLNTYASITYAF
jgi:hemolysin activation/secretion protein